MAAQDSRAYASVEVTDSERPTILPQGRDDATVANAPVGGAEHSRVVGAASATGIGSTTSAAVDHAADHDHALFTTPAGSNMVAANRYKEGMTTLDDQGGVMVCSRIARNALPNGTCLRGVPSRPTSVGAFYDWRNGRLGPGCTRLGDRAYAVNSTTRGYNRLHV